MFRGVEAGLAPGAEVIGAAVTDLDTPALVVDVDAMDRNIRRIAGHLRAAGVAWRPHTKGIKIPALAQRLIDAGAVGVTCAKVSEAEVMVAAGIHEVLIANQVVGEKKIRRLASLCRSANVACAVDGPENARQIGSVAVAAGMRIGVLIEVNVGLDRCGVEPGAAAVRLARVISGIDGLRLEGVMAWEGHAQLIAPEAEKAKAIEKAVYALTTTADLCRAAGLPIRIVSCGGSGTFRFTARQPGVTEIQAGGGVFGGVFYEQSGAQVESALMVEATVTSRPTSTRIVADAGKKTMSCDTAMPRVVGLGGVRNMRLAAEHATIELEAPNDRYRVGDRIVFVVGHEDTTVCLHDLLYGVRAGVVVAAWPILGRGKLQ